MIAYFLKVILCSGILFIAYKLFLEKEKLHQYKRFYLLFSLLFSFISPFISFETSHKIMPIVEAEQWANNIGYHYIFVHPANQAANTSQELPLSFPVIIYLLFVFVLFIRFSGNLLNFYKKIRVNEKILYQNSVIVLIEQPVVPGAFQIVAIK